MRLVASGDRSARPGSGSIGYTGGSEGSRSCTCMGSRSGAAFIPCIHALYSTKRARFKRFARRDAIGPSRSTAAGRARARTWPDASTATLDERRNAPSRAAVADDRNGLSLVVREQPDLPVLLRRVAQLGQTADRPLVAGLHHA